MHVDRVYGYFPSEKLEDDIWKNCYFIFDTSSLLELYFFSRAAQDAIFDNIFENIKGSIGIPAQVEFEYLKNREKTMLKPISEKYQELNNEVMSKMTGMISDLKKQVKDLYNRTKNADSHPYVSAITTMKLEELTNEYEKAFLEIKDSLQKEIKAREEEIKSYTRYDLVFEKLKKYVEVGEVYSFDKVLEIAQDGETRYRLQISPGYKDAHGQLSKDGITKFSDLIIWKQIIDFAILKKKSIVLVSNDLKEDWCHIVKNRAPKRVDRPNEDLIQEIWNKAKVRFWMYSLSDFVYTANKRLNLNVNREILEELSSKDNNFFTEVDQKHLSPNNLGNAINEGQKYVGQIYQAGITGLLVKISVNVDTHYNVDDNRLYPLLIGIYEVDGETPAACLVEFQVNRKKLALSDEVGLPVQIQQIAGKKYAIVVSFLDAPRHDPSRPRGSWHGSSGFHFDRGASCSSDDGIHWQISRNYNLHFVTYVVAQYEL